MIKRGSTGVIVITSEGSKMQCNDHGRPPLDWTAELKIKPTERRKWLHKTEDLNTFLCTYEARYVPKLWPRHAVSIQTSCCLMLLFDAVLTCRAPFCFVMSSFCVAVISLSFDSRQMTHWWQNSSYTSCVLDLVSDTASVVCWHFENVLTTWNFQIIFLHSVGKLSNTAGLKLKVEKTQGKHNFGTSRTSYKKMCLCSRVKKFCGLVMLVVTVI